jgi:hypothetical protein
LAGQRIRVFISHASHDYVVAERLIALMRAALHLPASAIRCTSVDGYRLPGGAPANEQLRREVHDSETFIGIVSVEGMRSPWVMFELGARWGATQHLVPLLAPGAPPSLLAGPLGGLKALRCDSRSHLHQLVEELAFTLSVPLQSAATFEKYVDQITKMHASKPADASVEVVAAETPATSTLSPDHLRVLQSLAEAGDAGLMLEDLVGRMKVPQQKAQEYIDGLLSGKYVSALETAGEPAVYLLEDKGLAFLVERGMR